MNPQGIVPQPWYKKKLTIAVFIVAGVAIISGFGDNNVSVQPSNQVAAPIVSQQSYTQTVSVQKAQIQDKQVSSPDSRLSNSNYYTNTAGSSVHSPAYSNSIPSGASAQCRDGTYSFSQSRRGTCSHHGVVASWLN